MIAKEIKIREVYGKYYDICKPDGNGWSKYQLNENRELISGFNINSILECEFNNFRQDNANYIYCIRPKSLQGIENNNGWIKIESKDDLPKAEIEYFVKRKNVIGVFIRQFVISHTKSWIKCYTHYQPIQKPKPPIY